MDIRSTVMTIIHDQVSKLKATSVIISVDIKDPASLVLVRELGIMFHYRLFKDYRYEYDIRMDKNKYLLELITLPDVEKKVTKVNLRDYMKKAEKGEQKDV